MKKSPSYYYCFPIYSARRYAEAGFTLIQLSIILTVASLIFVATLPGIQTSLKSSATSVTEMNKILNTMRGYMAANGVLPCPADPTLAIGASNFGVAAVNPGTGSPGNCTGGTPAAAHADTTNNIAIGMVPVKTLGLSYADALDGYGRDITYAVDTNATGNATGGPCWSSSSLTGAITINDNGSSYNTIAALVSHGADGYGAWLPLSGTSGTASRLDNGSTDTSQAANAQVATGGGLTPLTSGNFVSFVRKAATSTFDDSVVYKSNLYTLNTLPASAQVYPAITPPSNGTYNTPQTLIFTITYASNVTVNTANGTPRLVLSALGTGSIGTSNKAYATYQSGSGTTVLTFQYTVQASDSAPTSGIIMYSYIDLNGGTLSGGSLCFTAPNLTGVLIGTSSYYRTVTIDHTKVGTVGNTDQTNFPVLFSGTYSYLATTANGGQVTNTSGYDITFTSDAAGHTLLPFERTSWNATTGASVFWVQVPTVSHTADTVIYLQYGNSGITTDQSNKTGTWDSNYMGVWHLDETTCPQHDSTSNANTFSAYCNWNVKGGTAVSKIGGADEMVNNSNGTSTATDLNPANLTFQMWVNMNSFQSGNFNQLAAEAYSSQKGDGAWWAYQMIVDATKHPCLQWNSTTFYTGCGSSTLSASTWYLITATYTSATHSIQMYLNGAANGSATTTTGTLTAGNAQFGFGTATSSQVANSYVDETRVSSVARSADWIITDYNSENAPDKATYGASGFYTVGAQTSR